MTAARKPRIAALLEAILLSTALGLLVTGGELAPMVFGWLLGLPMLYRACLDRHMVKEAARAQLEAADAHAREMFAR